ncbi:MAG: acetate/propionate family kinase [Lacunisphaera sp.]
MKPTVAVILIINGGSSSIKFALFESGASLKRLFGGTIDGVGQPKGSFVVKGSDESENFSRPLASPNHETAVGALMDWLQPRIDRGGLAVIGHRVVHGGPKHWQPTRITAELVEELRQLVPFDPEHLPEEIALIEAFHHHCPGRPQIACFDTAFHHDLPRVAQVLPIPRRYEAQGVRRYGFHGLSYTYLLQELERVGGKQAAGGRVIFAHLGNGASMAAVRGGRCVDTSMALTPAAGLVMSTRSGDVDPGLVSFLARSEQMTPAQFDQLMNHQSGLLGVSETSSDMRELLSKETSDGRAAEAVALFCYQAKKWIGAYAAALGGLDTLVFAGGIGENSPPVRARICEQLGFLGIELDESRNAATGPVISTESSRTTVRVIRTDEESVIAQSACRLLGIGAPSPG